MQVKNSYRAAAILLSICMLATVTMLALIRAEPSFDGRYLSDWIWTMNGSEPGPEKEKARLVVRQLGANSIPLLLKWLRQEDRPSPMARLDQWRHVVFFWLVGHRLIPNRPIASLHDFNPSHSAMAMWALPELDHAGRLSAIPTLIRMLGEKSLSPDGLPRGTGGAYMVLSKMAPESIGPLTKALSSPERQVWALAAGALGEIGPDAKAAIPVLQSRLTDKDPLIRVGVAGVIDRIGGDPNQFLPVVIQSLGQVDRMDLYAPLEILLRHKERAKPAVTVLIGILRGTTGSQNPTNTIVRDQVVNALRQIDPGALTQVRLP